MKLKINVTFNRVKLRLTNIGDQKIKKRAFYYVMILKKIAKLSINTDESKFKLL